MAKRSCIEAISNVFHCIICLDQLKDAHLCPHCSQLCCYNCITRWLIESQGQCPYCRVDLESSKLVRCRWIRDVTTELNILQNSICANSQNNANDRCSVHHEEKTVYCWTCETDICYQCALWGSTHTRHRFMLVEDVNRMIADVECLKNQIERVANL